MIVSREEVMARFYKIGSTATAIGAIHILTLLLAWYVETDAGSITEIAGYNLAFPETLILSLVGGLMAGIGLLMGHVLKKLRSIKYAIGCLTVIGGLMAISSPIYAYLGQVSALKIKGYPTIGFFAAILTGIVQLGVGSLALLTPIKEEVMPVAQAPTPTPVPAVAPAQPPAPRAPAGTGRRVTTRILPAPDLEEAVCSICYEPIPVGEAMRCANCDAVFHRGCIEAWLSLNGTCPICKAVVVG
ncbi:MAG: hypothetical protein B6U65_01680 [Candidatus Wolframiiraptor sp. EX4484-121]|nr:MAG: hypothetical protein B6U65_01680 [Candidatus Wolframiiraptor sp. EX4484-121]